MNKSTIRKWLGAVVVLMSVLAVCPVASAALPGAGVYFSKTPIDPNNPAGLSKSFQAGDPIYGLLVVDKSWRELYGGKTEIPVMVVMAIDDQDMLEYQYITLKGPLVNNRFMVLDIAPEPARMTAYKDPNMVFGEGKGNRKIGPIGFTFRLGELGTGTHTVQIYVRDFGTKHAEGSFAIQGSNYAYYAGLNQKYLNADAQAVTLPPAKMTDKQMDATMRKLLLNAGWPGVHRIHIVDKDWWYDRHSGGDSPIVGRHIAAAALYKDTDGKYYYRLCTFEQRKLITGGFGALELTDQGRKIPIPAENIDK
ncbi:MAG TPA: hypothetical protein PK176_07360 [Acidobacteriota bacterium]|nr:hypothetical protein [Acidobacteriota bacterium]HQM63116.1 hypothetical protein [Acidobacteriota bacterium]